MWLPSGKLGFERMARIEVFFFFNNQKNKIIFLVDELDFNVA